jgi:hypothetical protein
MRNIPFAFINEETIDQINKAEREYTAEVNVDAFRNLAQTQTSMRGLISWPLIPKLIAILEKMMSMSGPNSIANLERAMRSRKPE